MTTIISLDGGLGRVITAIPALLKYHNNHLNEEWYITIPRWDFVTWGFPELQQKTFDPDSKGCFELFWKANKVISPEPYLLPSYYRNEISLREAFDVCINDSTEHSDLPQMQLKISLEEKRKAFKIIEEVKNKYKKPKTIVLQPYGSTATPHPLGIFDNSLRSIPENMLKYFIDKLSIKYNLIFMGAKEFYPGEFKIYKPNPDPNLREWMAIIEAADYFIGCDSCGQHMCKALNKKASVFIGGTHKVNVTYDNFHIIERNVPFYPDAMRISAFHSHMSSRLNEPRIKFTQDEIEKHYDQIVKNIEESNEEKEKIKPTENFKKSNQLLYR